MRINKSLITYQPASGAGSGTVTSVALSAPTGFTVSGSPVTTSGTLTLAFTTGYGIPPLMTGNSGKFLTTNGTTMSWANIAGTDVTGDAISTSNDTNILISASGNTTNALLRTMTLTAGWTGQLSVARGGTGAATLTGVVIGNATANMTAVAGTAGQFLRRNTANTAYEFRTLQGGDIAGSELTFTNDTNVQMTLGGTPGSALLQPVSITLGWTGQLAVGRGGTGASTLTGVLVGNGTSAVTGVAGTSGQLLRRNVANTAYEFFTASLISGSGVADRVARWTSATNLIDGTIYDNGTNIGIGTATPTHKLEVVGVISAGNTSAPNGSIMLQDSYTNGHLGNIGTMFSGGNLMLGYCVTPSTSSSTAFLSSTALTLFPRSAVVVGENVSIYTGSAQTVAVGSSVTMSEKMRLTSAGDLQMITGNIQLNTATNITWGGAYGTDIPTISGTSGSGSNGFLQFYPAGSTSGVKMALRRTGQLALPSYTSSSAFTGTSVATLAVTNAGDVITVEPQQTTASGTYTPTWTGLANVDSVTAFSCQYMRVGDTVTVSGWVTINATADNTPTSLSFSLPINSDTSVVNRLNGTGVQQGGGVAACLSGYGTNFGEFEVLPSVDTAINYSFHFTYRIV